MTADPSASGPMRTLTQHVARCNAVRETGLSPHVRGQIYGAGRKRYVNADLELLLEPPLRKKVACLAPVHFHWVSGILRT